MHAASITMVTVSFVCFRLLYDLAQSEEQNRASLVQSSMIESSTSTASTSQQRSDAVASTRSQVIPFKFSLSNVDHG